MTYKIIYVHIAIVGNNCCKIITYTKDILYMYYISIE